MLFMYHRTLTSELKELFREYPIVTVIGPRQSGKTTLVCYAFPDKPYVNLEAPDTRELIQLDPRGYLIYAGEQEQNIESFEILNYKHSAAACRIVGMD
jgi:predicted AAA+ superfamily ATPase